MRFCAAQVLFNRVQYSYMSNYVQHESMFKMPNTLDHVILTVSNVCTHKNNVHCISHLDFVPPSLPPKESFYVISIFYILENSSSRHLLVCFAFFLYLLFWTFYVPVLEVLLLTIDMKVVGQKTRLIKCRVS